MCCSLFSFWLSAAVDDDGRLICGGALRLFVGRGSCRRGRRVGRFNSGECCWRHGDWSSSRGASLHLGERWERRAFSRKEGGAYRIRRSYEEVRFDRG